MPTMHSDEATVIRELETVLGPGKVLSDAPSLTAYSIDAGIHKIPPRAVVLIESPEDLESTLALARGHRVPVTARSGGTNLTGNAIGSGIILEFSRMNRILEINVRERWVRVQPGVIYAELSRELARRGLMLGPDPSSGEMCKLGGMLGNNAAGPHTLKYGATKDHVIRMEILLADGRRMKVEPVSLKDPSFDRFRREHAWIDPLVDLVRNHAALLREKKPRVSKNSSGYNLFALAEGLDRGILDLPRLFVGSEGTLGLTLEATLGLLPKPSRTVTALLYLERFEEVGHAVNALLPLRPGALELLDANSLDLIGRAKFAIPETTRAVLLVELDEEPMENQVEALHAVCGQLHLTRPPDLAREPDHQQALWQVRKAIYPTLYRFESASGERRKPVNFADDVVVAVERLPELIAYLDGLFRETAVPVAIFGHVGNGNAHITPLLDITAAEDFDKMIRLSRQIHETVINRFGGSICGEHGDGRVRGEFVRALYGDDLFGLFSKTKKLLDPDDVLNPGVKITDTSFTEHIDIERLSKSCATCGRCNTVCPVYDVRLEESNGARGWFHILTDPDYDSDAASRVVEACLNCKSCRVVCPAGLDVSSLVLDKRAETPNRMAGFFFRLHARPVLFEPLLKLAARTQVLWDRPAVRKGIARMAAPVLKRIAPTAGLPANLILPKLAARTLRERHRPLTEEGSGRGSVAYFHGCAANYFADGVGDAVIGVLKKNGVDLVLPRQRCSGTPVETYGHRDIARDHARFNLESLRPYDRVVTGCASCTLMLKDYARFFDGKQRDEAERLAGRVRHVTEFLVNELDLRLPESHGPEKTVTYHSSCHLRAAGVTREPRKLLEKIPGSRFVEMRDSDRCAGGAGTYLVKDWDLSRRIFGRKEAAIRDSGTQVVATSCPACMIQLENGLRGEIPVKHVIQLVNEAYGKESG
jgi:FAD/FMN-containing dehydrogenase/Fe-S oxidoreductase